MGVVALERKKIAPDRQMDLGRQGLQLAAMIAAQLPDNREDAATVLGIALDVVNDWLRMKIQSRECSE